MSLAKFIDLYPVSILDLSRRTFHVLYMVTHYFLKVNLSAI